MWRNHSSASLEYSHQPQIFGANALTANSNCNPQPRPSPTPKSSQSPHLTHYTLIRID
ncbi:hypothetical protein BIFPSEUDO_04143 [Bifidobacterium pseudocatenulatum DSM 20438 = JCM 1200 = LMG 10505]|uniref:Uncharacterized protein n=1 Tax=Bifidobacterium pseudocatenulatum DSM 20438 = JCM 1200 = LMG 10505 TaxID=547043 RepID=C0BUQ4_BIFPS|nr:hypothetical protein BIFPSEUDO_04143 [Bifidobacterium pseudocatenulatum DSM 20438 = JCM 1200 = LMG 10505]BAR04329.1 hypothetical protein BBPC_1651 [Bifidobacterium pseudocatenulatum DSM 20438 = JCM 1200 = LMG 10505]